MNEPEILTAEELCTDDEIKAAIASYNMPEVYVDDAVIELTKHIIAIVRKAQVDKSKAFYEQKIAEAENKMVNEIQGTLREMVDHEKQAVAEAVKAALDKIYESSVIISVNDEPCLQLRKRKYVQLRQELGGK